MSTSIGKMFFLFSTYCILSVTGCSGLNTLGAVDELGNHLFEWIFAAAADFELGALSTSDMTALGGVLIRFD